MITPSSSTTIGCRKPNSWIDRAVQGHMDCRLTKRDGEPAVEWSWDGNAEMDAAQGRGWAVLRGDELHGMIFFHGGDDSEFVATRMTKKATRRT